MKKTIALIFFLIVSACNAESQVVVDSSLLLSNQDLQWWRDAKFGLFIHYGLYSILGQGEWAMFNQRIDVNEYRKLKDQFTCARFNAEHWVDVVKSAGCKYMVVTARHHDGFCLFDTHFGSYDAVNSAAKRDLIVEYAKAARRANMRMGIYYSPLDWRYPGFFFPDMYRSSAEDMKKQTYAQIRELLTRYGKVDILWFDGGEDNWLGLGGLMWDGGRGWYTRGFDRPYNGRFSWEPLKLNRMVRDHQPKIVISQRSGWMGDFLTQEASLHSTTHDRPWELCLNLGGAEWGWTPAAVNQMMNRDSCIRLLVTVVCQDGNLLLNVGPRPDGNIEPAQVQRLKDIGRFLMKYGESIYGTRGGTYDAQWGGTTITDTAIYVHILRIPHDGIVTLPPMKQRIVAAKNLEDDVSFSWEQSEAGITLSNISASRDEPDHIVKLILK